MFDITSRTPEKDRRHYSVGLSFLNARAMARGPLWGGRGAWLASARSGYMDLVFGLIQQNDLPSPRYHDFFAKLQVDLTSAHRLSFDALHAGDRYTYDAPATTGFLDTLTTREDARNHYGNTNVWTTLRSALGTKTVLRNMVSASLVTRTRDGSERYVDQIQPLYTLRNERDYIILGFKQDWSHGLTDGYLLSYGIDLRRFHMTDAFQSVVGADPDDPSQAPSGAYPVITSTSLERTGTRIGLYLSNRLQVTEPLILEIGARYDQASYTKDRDFSPRASAAFRLAARTTLRAGWGHYRQIQGIDDVAALNDNNRYYPSELSELSEQWTAGLEHFFSNGTRLRAEAYLKQGSHLRPVYRNWKGGIDTFPETNEDRILVFPIESTSKGLELAWDHRFGSRLAARASYAYSIGREEVDRIENVNDPTPLTYERALPIPQDQRHAANVDFTHKLRQRWSVNGSLAYHSGWPGTLERLVEVTNEDGEPDSAVRPQQIYGTRLPNYLRFDVRATRRWTTSRGDVRFFVELVNLTNHSNIFGYDYFRTRDPAGNIVLKRDDETWFTILPSIGVAWSSSF